MADTTALKNRIRAAIKANDNQEITGPVLQQTLLDIVDELDLNPELESEANARQNADTQLNNLITGIKNNIDNGYVYAGIAIPSTVPVSGKVFYVAIQTGTYTNFGDMAVTQGINILKYNGSAWIKEQVIYGDGGIFDVTAQNSGATFVSLEALLGDANLSTLIPVAARHPNMTISFICTSNNKYIQYRLKTASFSTAASDWQKADVELYVHDVVGNPLVNKGFFTQNQSSVCTWYNDGTHLSIAVKPGDKVEITANSNESALIAFSFDDTDFTYEGDTVNIDTTFGTKSIQVSQTNVFTVTDNTVRLLVDLVTGPYNRTPVSVKVNGYDYYKDVISNIISEILRAENADSTINGAISELSTTQSEYIEKISLNYTDGKFYDRDLEIQNYEYSSIASISVNKGDYYILDSVIKGDMRSGVKNANGDILEIHGPMNGKVGIFITSDNCELCITKWNGQNTELYKVNINAVASYITSYYDELLSLVVEKQQLVGAWGEGFYERGVINTSYMPDVYGHYLFEIPTSLDLDNATLKVSCSNTAVNADSICVFDSQMTPLLVLNYSETGKVLNNYSLQLPRYSRYVGVNSHYTAKTSATIFLIKNTMSPVDADSMTDIGSMSQLGVLDYHIPDDFDYSCLFIYGQSLAQGGAAQGAVSMDAINGNFTLSSGFETSLLDYSEVTLTPMKCKNVNQQEHPIIGLTNAFSTLWRRYRNKECKFIGFSGGYSGAQLENISKGSTYYTKFINAVNRVKSIADDEGKTSGCIGIVFMQGESNYIPNSGVAEQNKAGYKDLIIKLKEDLQSDLKTIFGQQMKPLFFMYQTGYKWIRNNHFDCSISQAQLELSQEMKDVILLNPTYQLTINSSQHPNYNGYRWYGELIAKGMFNAIYHNNRYETVRPIGFRTIGNNKIAIDCYAPVYPIKIDTHTQQEITNYGFDVRINGVLKTIHSVSVKGNSIVLDTVDFNLSTDIVEVSYAGLNRQGQGNICDSDNWQSLSNYEDDTDNSPHNTANFSYPVVKRPYDVNGKNIFGKPYPMQNWLTNFYYNLTFYFVEHLVRYGVGTTFKNEIVNNAGVELTYTSSNTSVATIDASGNVTIVGSGSCYIKAAVNINNIAIDDSYLLIVN